MSMHPNYVESQKSTLLVAYLHLRRQIPDFELFNQSMQERKQKGRAKNMSSETKTTALVV